MINKSLMLLFCLALTSSLRAEIAVYPYRGGLNPRVPVVPLAPGGAKGKAAPFERVSFAYRLTPHLVPADTGEVKFFFRENPRREGITLLTLADAAGRELQVKISPASEGRKLQLVFGKLPAATLCSMAIGRWQEALLTWNKGKVELKPSSGPVARLDIPADFRPVTLGCLAWAVDELELRAGGGVFRLDWENDYAARVQPAGSGGIASRLFGFDSFVIGTDPAKRDCPMLQLSNSTAAAGTVKLDCRITSEINKISKEWQEQLTVPAGTALTAALKFPFALKTDIYHLQVKVSGADQAAPEKFHFMYVEPNRGKKGPGLFGLHDCDVSAFGFWPDALALRFAHKYLRWGYVVGPAWVKDWNGGYGLDPATPAEEWNWNARLDWELLSGRDMYVCLGSYPYGNWYRQRPYATGMHKYPWGQGGGFPKLDYYEKFVREAALRYQGKIKRWEVENEPNATGHMPDHPDDYAAIAAAVNRAVKGVDPHALIYGICGTSTFVPWMKKALAAGAAKNLDIISWHTYTTPEQPDKAALREMLDAAKKALPAGKRVFNSETGVLCVLRRVPESPIPPEEVAAKVKAGADGFVTHSAWPGRVNDEWQASSSMVKNVIINFLAGAEGFIFFGWNPDWPREPQKWLTKKPDFSMISAAANGERTPSRFTLAVGVITAQMAGVDLKRPFRAVDTGAIRGGIFSTVSGGETAVLWSTAPTGTLLLSAPEKQIEKVSVFGQASTCTGSGNGAESGVFVIDLDAMPVYIHSAKPGLRVLPSPVEKVTVKDIAGEQGKVTFTLLNRSAQNWAAAISPEPVTGLAVTPARINTEVGAKRRKLAEFVCRPSGNAETGEYWVPFRISLPTGGSFIYSVKIVRRPSVTPAKLPENLTQPDPSLMAAHGKPLLLNRVEQAVVGRPSPLASLQEDFFWGGKDELSAQAWIGYNRENLLVAVKVHDAKPQLPANWPDVRGSSIELFFDFRSADQGLGSAYYGDKVYQFLVLPAIAAGTQPKVWSSQLPDLVKTGVKVSGRPIDAKNYWIGLSIPWRLVSKDGQPLKSFGFDVGVNGAFPDKPGRKTQLMLFGTAQNCRDASAFGAANLE